MMVTVLVSSALRPGGNPLRDAKYAFYMKSLDDSLLQMVTERQTIRIKTL